MQENVFINANKLYVLYCTLWCEEVYDTNKLFADTHYVPRQCLKAFVSMAGICLLAKKIYRIPIFMTMKVRLEPATAHNLHLRT